MTPPYPAVGMPWADCKVIISIYLTFLNLYKENHELLNIARTCPTGGCKGVQGFALKYINICTHILKLKSISSRAHYALICKESVLKGDYVLSKIYVHVKLFCLDFIM